MECSADDGRSWHTATLTQGADQPRGRAWAWTFWECEVPMPKPVSDGEGEGASAKSAAPGPLTLMCRAVDTSFNSQPADVAQAA